MIFVSDEIPENQLFDENTIIDLSRIGSNETKSLIMGMIVLKLQEYRMSNHSERNTDIMHFTILEEAHNLLKRSSVDSVGDGGSLTAKSVEMLSNAIAEMRTYGEGFIIVDQAPGLLDMAAIRNTNTKIIMRLPDKTDRELVGYAANLNDDQITEIARLPKGVGAIYQNDWVEPVLCKIDKADDNAAPYTYKYKESQSPEENVDVKINVASWLSNGTQITDENSLKDIKDDLMAHNIPASTIVSIFKLFENSAKEPRMTKLGPIMSVLFPGVKDALKTAYNDTSDKAEWTKAAERELLNEVGMIYNEQLRRDIIQSIITYYLVVEVNKPDVLKDWSIEGGFRK